MISGEKLLKMKLNYTNMNIKFFVVESLVLNKPSIKSPEARGPYTTQRTYVLPKNSTIVGTILSVLYRKGIIKKSVDWSNIEDIEKHLKELNIDFYGPFAIDKINKNIYIDFFDSLIRIDAKTLESIVNKIKDSKDKKSLKKIIKSIKEENKPLKNKISKIGIALRNDKKIVMEGYLYSQEILMLDNMEIVIECLSDCNNIIQHINNEITRFGGKGRVVKIYTDNNDEKLWEKYDKNIGYAILISDAILDIKKLDIENCNHPEEIPDKIKENYGFKVIYGELEYRSLGWDINKNMLKPYYLMLKAGSLSLIHI